MYAPYAPFIYGDVTVTVTGEIATALIRRARLGEARDDCWLLRDGTTTIVAKTALTDALVVIAEDDPTETVQTPSARHEAPVSQRDSQPARTSTEGRSLMFDFLLKALDHDAINNQVIELLSGHAAAQRSSLGTLADDLRSVIYRAIGEASAEDWHWVTAGLLGETYEALGIEHPLDHTPPGAEPPHRPEAGRRAQRSLDSGELREKLATIYASGTASQRERRSARLIVRHISWLTDLSREQIEADARADAEAINELIHAADGDRVSPKDRGSAQAVDAPTPDWLVSVGRLGLRDVAPLLRKGDESTDQEVRKRCGIILASNVGITPRQIAAIQRTTVAYVATVITEYNERGISTVEDSQ
jgi:hypothetical protein